MQNWSKIPGFSDYLVSDFGEIKSIERTKTFKKRIPEFPQFPAFPEFPEFP